MNKTTDNDLKNEIVGILKTKHPASLTELGQFMGYKKISGSMTKKIRCLIPKLEELLKKNKAVRELDEKPAKKSPRIRPDKDKLPPRCKYNGYRADSNYGLAFDLLYQMGYKKPVKREDLVKAYARLCYKDLLRSSYDLNVILSPTQEGKFHKSADSACKRFPYYVRRLADSYVQLVIR